MLGLVGKVNYFSSRSNGWIMGNGNGSWWRLMGGEKYGSGSSSGRLSKQLKEEAEQEVR